MMERSEDQTEGTTAWLVPIFAFMKQNFNFMAPGVYSMASKALRMVESEGEIPEPIMQVGKEGTLLLRWSLTEGDYNHGHMLTMEFMDESSFRYRYRKPSDDRAPTMVVTSDYADSVRCIFRKAFATNNITLQAMHYHLGKRFQ